MSPKEKTEMPLVVEAIRNGYGEKGGVKSLGVNGFARASGISPALITRYLQGKVGEPTTATLQKLADYFGVPVPYLRGEETLDNALNGGFKEFKASIIVEAIQKNDPYILINKAKIIGYTLSKEQAKQMMSAAENYLKNKINNLSNIDPVALKAVENNISKQLLLSAIDFGISYLDTLTSIIKMTAKSPSTRSITEAFLILPEDKREEALAILQREGIIPPTTDRE